jgi:hypothetical protein
VTQTCRRSSQAQGLRTSDAGLFSCLQADGKARIHVGEYGRNSTLDAQGTAGVTGGRKCDRIGLKLVQVLRASMCGTARQEDSVSSCGQQTCTLLEKGLSPTMLRAKMRAEITLPCSRINVSSEHSHTPPASVSPVASSLSGGKLAGVHTTDPCCSHAHVR